MTIAHAFIVLLVVVHLLIALWPASDLEPVDGPGEPERC